MILAAIIFLIAVFVAKPVFLTPLQTEPMPQLSSTDIIASLTRKNLVGYTPNTPPYDDIMARAAKLMDPDLEIISAPTEEGLNSILYNRSMGTPIKNPVIWIIFHKKDEHMWKFSIRSTERARFQMVARSRGFSNPHLRTGFLGLQVAVSQALLERSSPTPPKYEISLVSMPVSPLMRENKVRRAISGVLLCVTIALIPPVIETQALVVSETLNKFKHALRMRNVAYSTIYIAWLMYAYMTAIPICVIGSLALILIFRWIHLFLAFIILLAYVSVMIMVALIMAMLHSKPWIASLWTVLFTLLQSFLAELMVYHKYDTMNEALTFLLHVMIPPLGLVHALNEFALLMTHGDSPHFTRYSITYTISLWVFLNLLYFALLMMLQRTMSKRAIGGQVSWKSIIFKKIEDKNKLHKDMTPSALDNAKLQEVDELVAKAISFRNVSKRYMNVPMIKDVSFDMYRGEFNMLFSERIQHKTVTAIEDLLTGLTQPDQGTINILGHMSKPGSYFMSVPNMMGYCHRGEFLLDDLTVEEHIILFADICLWEESTRYVQEYVHLRSDRLMTECNLRSVWQEYIRNLGPYYRAQVCWALALLLEPRIILIPLLTGEPNYVKVLKDKIMHYKKYKTIVMICYTSIMLEYADRVFIFDHKILVFGGTPAYMFFKYGREYRVRMTFRHGCLTQSENENISELLQRATAAGATVRAHLGSLLILRLPSSPTANAAALVKDLDDNAKKYGITSLSISLPDSEEVSRRAIYESRAAKHETSAFHQKRVKEAMQKIGQPPKWKRSKTCFLTCAHLRAVGWKFIGFYRYHKAYLIITLLSGILAGVCIGYSMSTVLSHLKTHSIESGDVLTVEAQEQATILVLRTDSSEAATSVANAYVLSETKATEKQIKRMVYTALSHNESLTEYLVTRAIDSPKQYVYMYAYGMDVFTDANDSLKVQVLYSPIHFDPGAAARSMARMFMALLRHYTGQPDASIQVIDDPLTLDLTPWLEFAMKPPFMIQFMLIVTITHITLIPSNEYGLIRHMQCHAMNFSPARYWFSLYFFDLALYLMQVVLTTIFALLIIHLTVPLIHFGYIDIAIIPIVLVIYGTSCIPQAYLFSLGPMPALNTMTFVIVNIVFGETTVMARLFYGPTLYYALFFMRLSPQFNMAYAYVKIKQIFLYNSECLLFKIKNWCSSTVLHKCCEKCGVLQKCFKPRSYFTWSPGVITELMFMACSGAFFMVVLLMWEHRLIHRFLRFMKARFVLIGKHEDAPLTEGGRRERIDVLEKYAQIKSKKREKVMTYGEYLLSVNVCRKSQNTFVLRNVFMGLSKGEVLALSGLKRHGRMRLVEVLSGYKIPSTGEVWCMSRWKDTTQIHMYSRNVSVSCERAPLPYWMTVREALRMLAVLRGVSRQHSDEEIESFIDAVELHNEANKRICELSDNEERKLHFTAAVVAAPPILVLDECTAYQKYSVRRAMYFIMYSLKKRGHGICISSSNVESHLPITNRLAIMVDGFIYDIDHIDQLVERYSNRGCTIVVHLKDEIEVTRMFARYFNNFVINDVSEVLVNVQLYDYISWSEIFEKMELLQAENSQVYSYIISAIPIDYIYNSILTNERGLKPTGDIVSLFCLKKMFNREGKRLRKPYQDVIDRLTPFEKKYDITTLKDLPWSVIFRR